MSYQAGKSLKNCDLALRSASKLPRTQKRRGTGVLVTPMESHESGHLHCGVQRSRMCPHGCAL
jgi:hypothetical protein